MKKTLALATQKALEIIRTFPLSYNRKPYLRLKDGRKCFFDIFIRKYGLDGSITKYTPSDVLRRIRLVEFFDTILKNYTPMKTDRGNLLLETKFYRMVIGLQKSKKQERLVAISFYDYD